MFAIPTGEPIASAVIHMKRSQNGLQIGKWLIPSLPTAREGNIFTGVCHSVHNLPHGYSVTAHPCYGAAGMHHTGMLSCLVVFLGTM